MPNYKQCSNDSCECTELKAVHCTPCLFKIHILKKDCMYSHKLTLCFNSLRSKSSLVGTPASALALTLTLTLILGKQNI